MKYFWVVFMFSYENYIIRINWIGWKGPFFFETEVWATNFYERFWWQLRWPVVRWEVDVLQQCLQHCICFPRRIAMVNPRSILYFPCCLIRKGDVYYHHIFLEGRSALCLHWGGWSCLQGSYVSWYKMYVPKAVIVFLERGGTVVSMEDLLYIFSLIDMDHVFSSTGKPWGLYQECN